MSLPIYTAYLAAYLVILQQILMLMVGTYRARVGRGVGTGDDLVLERMVRRHGNLAENAGVFLIAVALLEMIAGSTAAVYWLCIAFAAARTLHAIGFSSLKASHQLDTTGSGLLFLAARSVGATGSALAGLAGGIILLMTLSG